MKFQRKGCKTHQDQMKSSSPPLLHRFLTIASKVILDFLSFHEGRKDSLINRIIFINLISHKKKYIKRKHNIPSTIRTLIGGTTLVSEARTFPFCFEDAGGVIEPLLSAEGRLPSSRREPSAGDVLGEEFFRDMLEGFRGTGARILEDWGWISWDRALMVLNCFPDTTGEEEGGLISFSLSTVGETPKEEPLK